MSKNRLIVLLIDLQENDWRLNQKGAPINSTPL
jgi:hypothetical protein